MILYFIGVDQICVSTNFSLMGEFLIGQWDPITDSPTLKCFIFLGLSILEDHDQYLRVIHCLIHFSMFMYLHLLCN